MGKIRNRSMRNAGHATLDTMRNAGHVTWDMIKLSMSNAGSVVIGVIGLGATIGTGGTALAVGAGTVGLLATAKKTTSDFYAFKKEENLQNMYNALNEFQDNIITFKAEIEKHPEIFKMYQDIEQAPSNINTALQYDQSAALSNAVASVSSALLGCASSAASIYANPTLVTESFGAIAGGCAVVTGCYIGSEIDRIKLKSSTDIVNDIKQDLGVETDDANEIAELAAALKMQINVLKSSTEQHEMLTPEAFEEKSRYHPEIKPTQYTQKSNGTIAYEAFLDTFNTKKLKTQEKNQESTNTLNKVFAKKITSQLQQQQKTSFVARYRAQQKSGVQQIF